MPLLARGDEAGLAALKSATPESFSFSMDDWVRLLHKTKEFYRPGDLIEWKFVGKKRIGTMLCQYVYLSRSSEVAMFWAFDAREVNGRMTFSGYQVWLACEKVFDQLPADDPGEDSSCDTVCSELRDLLAQGDVRSIEAFRKCLVFHDPEAAARLEDVLRIWLSTTLNQGRPQKHELARQRCIGGFLREYCYVFGWRNGNVAKVQLYLYRYAENWKLLSYNFELATKADDFRTMFQRTAFDSKPSWTTSWNTSSSESNKTAKPQTKASVSRGKGAAIGQCLRFHRQAELPEGDGGLRDIAEERRSSMLAGSLHSPRKHGTPRGRSPWHPAR